MTFTGLVFLIAFALGLLAALLKRPAYGLAIYVLVMFVHPPSRWWGASLPDLRWSLVAAIVTLVSYWIHGKKAPRSDSVWSNGIFVAYFALFIWMLIQVPWAIWFDMHVELVELFAKYLVMIFLIYRIIDSEEELRLLLWSYVCGCFYLGWIAYTTYAGGRFEGYGGPDIGEANAGSLTLVTGIFVGAGLFLTGGRWQKGVLLAMMPFIVNGMILASSRSSLLATVAGGLLFFNYAPRLHKRKVAVLGTLALVMFMMLTNSIFWGRMSTLKHAGEANTVVVTDTGHTYDTGDGRLRIIEAQWRMFLANPLGHGHRGTAALSPYYMSDTMLTGESGQRYRSSHNTFMSMLVEHGVVGAAVYLYSLWWVIGSVRRVFAVYRYRVDFRATTLPAVTAALAGIFMGDMFVDYLKLEPRLWFLAVLMVMVRWAKEDAREAVPTLQVAHRAPSAVGGALVSDRGNTR